MDRLRAQCEQSPLTNRGVEVTEASFRGVGRTGWLPHDPRILGPRPGGSAHTSSNSALTHKRPGQTATNRHGLRIHQAVAAT